MGDVEFGKCDICGMETQLSRKYYRYDIKCTCCNSENDPHFEIVKYCHNCEPRPPRSIKAWVKPMTEKEIKFKERNKKLKILMTPSKITDNILKL